ncbi:MAG TPA: FRG domain-containing protein [Phycisphaerales bacterium]
MSAREQPIAGSNGPRPNSSKGVPESGVRTVEVTNTPHDFAGLVTQLAKTAGWDISRLLFRGHPREEYQLLPGLYRRPWASMEADIYKEVRQRIPYAENRPQESSWEFLSRMQHHGIPTRLLDWTDSFAVALFFALRARHETPCVWVLDPIGLNREATGKAKLYDLPCPELPEYRSAFVDSHLWSHPLPITVRSSWSHDRIRSQRGYFTVHGNRNDALEKSCPAHVARIVIRPGGVTAAENFLKIAGVDEAAIFPDFDGVARWISWKYG